MITKVYTFGDLTFILFWVTLSFSVRPVMLRVRNLLTKHYCRKSPLQLSIFIIALLIFPNRKLEWRIGVTYLMNRLEYFDPCLTHYMQKALTFCFAHLTTDKKGLSIKSSFFTLKLGRIWSQEVIIVGLRK